MDRWKSRGGKTQRGEKQEDAGALKGRKVAKHCVFPMICGSRGSKSRLAKAAGAEPSGQMRDEKLHTVVARSTFGSEKAKNTSRSEHFGSWAVEKVHAVVVRSTFGNVRTTFRSCDVQKVHTVVARSTFPSQNVKNTTCSDHLHVQM